MKELLQEGDNFQTLARKAKVLNKKAYPTMPAAKQEATLVFFWALEEELRALVIGSKIFCSSHSD